MLERLAYYRRGARGGKFVEVTPDMRPAECKLNVAALYAVEKDIRGRGADERRTARQQKSQPLTDALEPWLRARLGLISQKSKFAEAIRYAVSRCEGLTRFIDDGRIELDNNTVERSICTPMAPNMPNIGPPSPHLIETPKLNDVLIRIVNGHPNSDIDQLLLWPPESKTPGAVA